MNEVDAEIGLQVRLWRCFRGLSIAELASCLHVTPGQMRALEDGRCSFGPYRLYTVAQHLKIRVDLLIAPSWED